MGYKVIVDIQLCSYTRAMPLYCSVNACRSVNDQAELIFHLFPKDEEVKKKWIKFADKGEEWHPKKKSYICSLHFDRRFYHKAGRRLKRNAIPTLRQGKFPSALTKE